MPCMSLDALDQEKNAVPGQLEISSFRKKIWDYYHRYGRSFPWRETEDPYSILVSELMLQQTQTERVIKKYGPFLDEFPDWAALADAPLSQVLRRWSGLGYNKRALGLKRIAEIIHRENHDTLPGEPEFLLGLPMVGPATAGSLQAFIFNRPVAFIETNIRRVILHHFFHGMEGVHDRDVLEYVGLSLDETNPRHWYYAMMDYGVYLKYAIENPNRKSAHYRRQSPFENSNRQIRGRLVAVLAETGPMTEEKLRQSLSEFEKTRVRDCLRELAREGFLSAEGGRYGIRE